MGTDAHIAAIHTFTIEPQITTKWSDKPVIIAGGFVLLYSK